MRKRNGIVLVGMLAVALVVAGYFIRKEKQIVVVDPWTAVPSDAFLIIETSDFPELLTRATDRNGIISILSDMKWAAAVTDAAAAVDLEIRAAGCGDAGASGGGGRRDAPGLGRAGAGGRESGGGVRWDDRAVKGSAVRDPQCDLGVVQL